MAAEKQFRKLVRKMLVLVVDRQTGPNQGKSQLVHDCYGSQLHMAQIMTEHTQTEKQVFGKVQLEGPLTEDRVDWLIDQYMVVADPQPVVLITETLTRSKQRLATQIQKLDMIASHQAFFTEAGVEQRQQKIKIKVLMAQVKSKSETDIKEETDVDSYLRMLTIHNLDTARIRKKYIDYRELREKAEREGVPFEELKKREEQTDVEPEAEKVDKPKRPIKLKAKKKKKAEVEMCIVMKDKDGNIINFDEN